MLLSVKESSKLAHEYLMTRYKWRGSDSTVCLPT